MADPRDDALYAQATSARGRILHQLSGVEHELGKMYRSNPKRHALLQKKELLLRSLREEKVRLKEIKVAVAENPDHPVTDHALVRWLERKAKVDIRQLKDSILSEELKSVLASGKRVHWSDGEMVFVLSDKRVITVIREDEMWQEVVCPRI